MPDREYMEQLRRSKREMPPMSELAARIRDGETAADIARQYGIEKQGLSIRMRGAGYRAETGEVENDARRREVRSELAAQVRSWIEPWMDDAACAYIDSELWFPDKGGSTRDVKAFCRACPVMQQCLEYALRNNERFGVWGGMSERERRKLAKERAA